VGIPGFVSQPCRIELVDINNHGQIVGEISSVFIDSASHAGSHHFFSMIRHRDFGRLTAWRNFRNVACER